MEKLIGLLLLLSYVNLFPQDTYENHPFSALHLGVLGGANYSATTGVSFILEAKTNLTSNLNLKFSLGYVESYKNNFRRLNQYQYISFFNQYRAYSYNLNRVEYDIVPLSIGLEYVFAHNKISPYCFIEGGYNYYNSKVHNSAVDYENYYNSFNEIPAEYRNPPLIIYDGNTARLGLGAGTQLRLSGKLNLDLRYMYQFNSGLINTHQILIGFAY